MGRGNRNSGRKKRSFAAQEDQEEIVDDLAHAATFAMMAPPVSGLNAVDIENNNEDDGNEIDVMEDDNDDDDNDDIDQDKGDDEKDAEEDSKNEDNDNEGDDNDSDIDIAEAVAKMEQQEDDGPTSKVSAPKTEHEVDAYQTPIQELEKHLHFQLSVQDTDGDGTSKVRQFESENLSLAGRLKHYMTVDRTVVVESIAPADGSATAPLDEGSLLVVNKPSDEKSENIPNLIPLGRIFEVFGPVTRPLYTIRLPAPPPTPKVPKKTAATNKSSDQSLDENKDEGGTGEKALGENETPSIPGGQVSDKSPSAETGTENESKSMDVETKELDASDVEKGSSENQPAETIKKDDEAKSTNEAENSSSNVTKIEDPWAPEGEFAKVLKANQDIAVYYVKDESKLIDTGAIMKVSGKGCDASNVYDEEVLNSNEMYYSDDEKERQAKSRRKSGRGQRQQQRHHQSSQNQPGQSVVPQGFHQSRPPPPSQRPLQGFHQPPPSPQGFYQQQQPQQGNPYYPSHAPNMGGPPPPPPPPRNGFAYPPGGNGMPPPPPPPPPGGSAPQPPTYPNSSAPPAYQY